MKIKWIVLQSSRTYSKRNLKTKKIIFKSSKVICNAKFDFGQCNYHYKCKLQLFDRIIVRSTFCSLLNVVEFIWMSFTRGWKEIMYISIYECIDAYRYIFISQTPGRNTSQGNINEKTKWVPRFDTVHSYSRDEFCRVDSSVDSPRVKNSLRRAINWKKRSRFSPRGNEYVEYARNH